VASFPLSIRRRSAPCVAARCRRRTSRSLSVASWTTRPDTARPRSGRRHASCASATTPRNCARNRRGEVELFAHPALALARLRVRCQRAARTSMPPGAPACAANTCGARRSTVHRWPTRRPARTDACIRTGSLRRCARCCDPMRSRLRRRRHPQLRPHGTGHEHLPRRRCVRLPRRRHALRRRRRAAAPGAAGRRRHRRRCLWHQRDGDRLRPAARRQGRLHRLEQRRLEHRAAGPGDELRRPHRRHRAGLERLRRDGARLRPARRSASPIRRGWSMRSATRSSMRRH